MIDSPLRQLACQVMDRHVFETRAVEDGLCSDMMEARRAWFELAPELTRGDILKMLTATAQKYVPVARKSVVRNSHMNRYSGGVNAVPQPFVEALVVDFINTVGVSIGVDYGLYTRHLGNVERLSSMWQNTIRSPQQMADHLNMLLSSQPDSERKAIFDTVMDGYCQHCGSRDLPCHCEDEE
jgi:hypothetical protein